MSSFSPLYINRKKRITSLQHNLPNIYSIALRVDDVYEIQAVAGPGAEADVRRLLVDGRLKHLLPQRIVDAQLVTIQRCKIAVIDGDVVVTWVGKDLDGIAVADGIVPHNAHINKQGIGYRNGFEADIAVV